MHLLTIPIILRSLGPYWMWGIPIILMIVLLASLERRRTHSPSDDLSDLPHTPPEGVLPAEMSVIIDKRVNDSDIPITLLDLARQGYIRIEKTGAPDPESCSSDFLLTLLDRNPQELTPFEQTVISTIFAAAPTRLLSDMRERGWRQTRPLKWALNNQVASEGYFAIAPDGVCRLFRIIGTVAIFGGLAAIRFTGSLSLGAAIIFAGIECICFAPYLSRRTAKGAAILDQIEGFRSYLNTIGADSANRHERADEFERYLPHAVALGIEGTWSRAYEGTVTQPPAWFSGQYGDPNKPFSPTVFVQDIDYFVEETDLRPAEDARPRKIYTSFGTVENLPDGAGIAHVHVPMPHDPPPDMDDDHTNPTS